MPAPELKVVTERVEQTQGFSAGGGIRTVVRVVYRVGDHGPFVVEIPEVEATPEKIKAEQQKRVDLLKAIL